MCLKSLWWELPIVPKVEQELPSYISTNARSGCLHLAISVAGPRVALPPCPRALFFIFPPSHPSFCQACSLHSPVASSLHVPCSSSGLCMSPVACKRATEPVALALCPGVHSANCRSRQRSMVLTLTNSTLSSYSENSTSKIVKIFLRMILIRSIMSFPFERHCFRLF